MKITTRINWGENTEENKRNLNQTYESKENIQRLKEHLQRKLAEEIKIEQIERYTIEEENNTLWVTFYIYYKKEEEVKPHKSVNLQLNKAMRTQNDEFYTMYEDIENELIHYHEQLKNKIIYLPADGREYSNFWKYLLNNYDKIKYKKVICTSVSLFNTEKATFDGREVKTEDHPSGNFEDNIELFKEADVVVTNPPFSSIKTFTKILLTYNCNFIIIGPLTMMFKEHNFEALKVGKMRAINKTIKRFVNPEGKIKGVPALWYTTLERKEFKSKNTLPKVKDHPIYYYMQDVLYLKNLKDLEKWRDYPREISVPVTIFQHLDKYPVQILRIIGNRIHRSASNYPNLKKYLRGKIVNSTKLPPLIPADIVRDNQHYWIDEDTRQMYKQPFAHIVIKWKKGGKDEV